MKGASKVYMWPNMVARKGALLCLCIAAARHETEILNSIARFHSVRNARHHGGWEEEKENRFLWVVKCVRISPVCVALFVLHTSYCVMIP